MNTNHSKYRSVESYKQIILQSILRFSSKSIQQKIEQLVFTIFDNYAILKTKDNDPLFYKVVPVCI